MNNYFDVSRFLNLFKKHTAENLKIYLMSLIVLGGILVLFFAFVAYMTKVNLAFPEVQNKIYFVTFLLSGAIFSSTVFSALSDTKNAIMTLLLPSSKIEKFLVAWTYIFIFFPIFFTALFYAVDSLFLFSLNPRHDVQAAFYNVFSADKEHYMVFIIYLVLASISFLGAVMFVKLHFIKTAALFFVIVLCLVLINSFLIHQLITPLSGVNVPFSGLRWQQDDEYYVVNIDSDLTYMIVTVCIISPVIWLSTYWKLKEKEV